MNDGKSSRKKEKPVVCDYIFSADGMSDFKLWVDAYVYYPVELFQFDLKPRTEVEFTIGTNGIVKDARVLSIDPVDIDPRFSEEAIRVVKNSPKWKSAGKGALIERIDTVSVDFSLDGVIVSGEAPPENLIHPKFMGGDYHKFRYWVMEMVSYPTQLFGNKVEVGGADTRRY